MNPDDIIPDEAREHYHQTTKLSDLSEDELGQEMFHEAMTFDMSNPEVRERVSIIQETFHSRLDGRRPVY